MRCLIPKLGLGLRRQLPAKTLVAKRFDTLVFAVAAHNAIWEHDDEIVRVGGMMGGGILMSFAVECALKALLDMNKIEPDRVHNLQSLFGKLPQETQVKLHKVYNELLAA